MNKSDNYERVEDYFDSQAEEVRIRLIEIRNSIFKLHPDAEELFNYNIPSYTLKKGGKREEQIMMAGYTKHIGFYPHPKTIDKFQEELSEYKKGKGSVQFPLNKPLPLDLIEEMVQFRMNALNS